MNLNDIGQHIAQARKRQKLKQSSLATQLGMSRATLSGIENGTVAEIGIRKVLSVCAALGLELNHPGLLLVALERDLGLGEVVLGER